MVILLEFGIGKTVLRRIEVDQESFENALYMITPPPLREKGFLPFENNVLHPSKYVRSFWNLLLTNEKLSSLMYTGQFLNKFTMIGYGFTYSVESAQQAVGSKKRKTPLDGIVVRQKVFCVDGRRH
jgi:hypothetical protein